MKKNIYDLFSEYEGELPDIEEASCDTDRIKRLVLSGTVKKNISRRHKPKIFLISFAAAVTAVTGVTAAAYTGGFSRFRSVLHKSSSESGINKELPLVNNDDISGMENNIKEEKTVFTGSDFADISTVGMYYDNSTLMISIEIDVAPETELPADSIIIPYISKYHGGIRTELYNYSGISSAAPLIKGDEDGVYYSTFYITENELSGSTIDLQLRDIITESDRTEIFDKLMNEQNKWREEFDIDSHTVEEWKEYWKSNDLDERTRKFAEDCVSECEPVLAGTWSAEIEIPEDIASVRIFESSGFRVTADTLSLTLDVEKELPVGSTVIPVVTMKNGTAIIDGGTKETEWIFSSGLAAHDKTEYYAYRAGNVFSYSAPHHIEDIEKINIIVFDYDKNKLIADNYTIYDKETQK